LGLTARGLRFRYPGGRWLLDGAELEVRPGECVAVLGGNGAGKSTLLSILAGVIPRFIPGELEGECLFAGVSVREHSPACLRQNPDDQILCDGVREELEFFLSHSQRPDGEHWPVAELARQMGIADLMDRPVHRLSRGEKQRFALAGGLAFSAGRLLLLDEPAAFLDRDGRERLGRVLAGRKARGACIVMSGHEFAGLEPLIDRGVALGPAVRSPAPAPSGRGERPPLPGEENGCPSGTTGPCPSPSKDGGPLPAAPSPAGPVLLAVEGLAAFSDGRSVFSGLRLELRAGETAGICGPNGSGKSTLVRILAGIEAPGAGRILLSGRAVKERELWRAVAVAGENPYHGLLHATLGDCLTASRRLRNGEPALPLEEGIAALGLKGLLGRDPQTLSFGEAQKAAILCAVLSGPRVLVVDEPLLDLDPASLGGLRAVCAAMNRAGGAVLLISHVPGILESFCMRPPLSWEEARCATTPSA